MDTFSDEGLITCQALIIIPSSNYQLFFLMKGIRGENQGIGDRTLVSDPRYATYYLGKLEQVVQLSESQFSSYVNWGHELSFTE